MIVIDGSRGEGGGQVLRTSLTLAICLGQAVRIENIRAGRPKPGLLRQHLTCLRAVKEVSKGVAHGDELGSREVVFKPGKAEAGSYHFAIGSAGSTSLLFQTLLLPLLFSGATSEITLEGGTHNGHAPSFDFIDQCFLPVIEPIGYRVEVELQEFGFYPAGGGAWKARIHPVTEPVALDLSQRGEVLKSTAIATSSRIPKHVTGRELAQVQKKCLWKGDQLQQRLVESEGPGNILSLRICSEQAVEVIEVVGEKQLSAERVAGRAIKEMNRYLEAEVPVGEHLADQLLLPMALGKGGRFRTLAPSQHLLTNIEVIRQFMDLDIQLQQESEKVWQVLL